MNITSLTVEVKSVGIKQASQELGGLSTSAANATRRIENLTIATGKLQQASILSATAAQNLVTKLQQQATLMASFRTNTAASAASVQALAAATSLLAAAMATLAAQQGQADRTQRRHNEGMREAHGLARGLAGSLGALWVTYGNIAGMAVGVAIGASLKAIVTVGKDVEHALEGIRVRGEESVETIDRMREAVYRLGQGVYGPQEVVKAFDTLILAGLKAEDAMTGISAVLSLATVGGTTIDKSAEVLVQVGTALNYTSEGYARIADVIAKTAAVSTASVESISESFKSGSVIGKLYNQSLVDIGTQFAVLANLGIKNTQAGTAAKNFFSELASGSEKVTKGLAMIGLSVKDLQDSTGRLKSFNDIMRTLAGDSTKGLNSVTKATQDYVQSLLSNERGNKLFTEGLALIRREGVETGTAMDDLSKRINESWGFAAQGAAAMALTVQSQFKTVKNTLAVALGEAFTEIQPQISVVTNRLKEAFASEQFQQGVQNLALAVADLTVFLADNAAMLWEVIRAFLAFKAASMIGGMLVGIAQGFVAVKTALDLARISAIGFQMALGLLGVALAAGGALLVWWMTKRDEAAGNAKQRAALQYMDDFKGKLDEENERLRTQINLMLQGANATDAYNQAQQRLQLQNVQKKGSEAIQSATEEVQSTWKSFDPRTKEILNQHQMGKKPLLNPSEHYEATEAAKKLNLALANLNTVKQQVRATVDATSESIRRNISLSKTLATFAEEDARKRGVAPEGAGVVPPKVDKAAQNDAFTAKYIEQDNIIKAAKKDMTAFEESQLKLFKAGQIGKLTMIDEIGKRQVEKYGEIQKAIQDKLNLANLRKDQSDIARFVGEGEQAENDLANKKALNANSAEQAITQYQETQSRLRIAQLEKEGKFGLAAQERFSKEHSATYLQAAADATHYAAAAKKALTDGNAKAAADAQAKADIAKGVVDQLTEAQKSAAEEGFNREAMDRFMVRVSEVKSSLKGVQTAYEGQGLGAMWTAAVAASTNYKDRIAEIRQELLGATDPKVIATMNAELINLGEGQRKMWVGVGDAIGNSLESAFGRGGKAVGSLVDIATKYDRLENKTGQSRVKAFGDAAGAAKGFFKEGSTGYKVLEGAEKAFRMVELAGQAKSLATSIANAAATAAAWVPAVFASFMAKMGPWGLVAAGVALAAVGIAVSKGGGDGGPSSEERQRTQGTGSVLGSDAKSESIAKSIEHLEKNSGLGLYHSNEMVKSLKAIQNSMGSLASYVVQTTGISGDFSSLEKLPSGFWGKLSNSIFGGKITAQDTGFTLDRTTVGSAMTGGVNASSYADMKKDGGWFSSDKRYTDTASMGAEANGQFAKTISGFADVLLKANKELGIRGDMFGDELKGFVIDIGKISLKGLTGEEVEKELQAVFSKLGDDMAKWAFAGLTPFQKVGEGMLETITRVVSNLTQVKDVFQVLNKQFDVTGIAAIAVSESMAELAGGIETLTENTKFYVDNFLTEAERMGPITKSVNDRLKELNISEVKTIELFKQKIRGLNLMNAADRELYVNMIELAPAFKEAADYAQDLIDGTVDLTKAQEKALKAIESARSDLQAAYDKESSALQSVIDKTKTFIQTLATYKDGLKLGADSPLTNMQKYDESRNQLSSVLEKAMGGDQAAKDKFTSAASAFLSASKLVNASGAAYQSDFMAVQAMIDKLSANAGSEVDVAQASLDALNRQVAGLLDINKSVLTVAQAIINLQQAIGAGAATGLNGTQMGGEPIGSPAPSANLADELRRQREQNGELVKTLAAVESSIEGLRSDQKQQVGAQIAADIQGTEKIVEVLSEVTPARNEVRVSLA